MNKKNITPTATKRVDLRSGRNKTSEPRTILVPIDFSTNSVQALAYAALLARRFGAALVLVHVLDPIFTQGRLKSPRLQTVRAEALRDAKTDLAKLAQRCREGLSQPAEAHVTDGAAHAAIIEFARKSKANWIVMGSKGRTGMQRFFTGSVAERVVRFAPCPVLIVP